MKKEEEASQAKGAERERIQRIMAEGQQVRRNMKRKRRVGAGPGSER